MKQARGVNVEKFDCNELSGAGLEDEAALRTLDNGRVARLQESRAH